MNHNGRGNIAASGQSRKLTDHILVTYKKQNEHEVGQDFKLSNLSPAHNGSILSSKAVAPKGSITSQPVHPLKTNSSNT